jgi:hypothetical protein
MSLIRRNSLQSWEEVIRINFERQEQLELLTRSEDPNALDSLPVQGIKNCIRESFEQLLIQSPVIAHSRDIHHLLWKNCIYGTVEKFRGRMKRGARTILIHIGRPSPDSTQPEPAEVKQARKELAVAQNEFKAYVLQSTAFYNELIRRLQGVHDNANSSEAEETAQCRRLSVSRCFTYMGDLARYKELHSERAEKNWSLTRELCVIDVSDST